MRPIIGIVSRYAIDQKRYNLPEEYTHAVQRNGGTPFIIPPMYDLDQDQVLDHVDGVIIGGGPDVDPILYGEEPIPGQGDIGPLRDVFEMEFLKKVLAKNKPFLGISRGLQAINVAAGGTLIQDIPSQVENCLKHSQEAEVWHPTHHVTIEKGSKAYDIFGTEKILTNSFHHQACKTPAPGFKATGWTDDGVIHIIEKEDAVWNLNVQFHPERIDQPYMNNLFKSFIAACK